VPDEEPAETQPDIAPETETAEAEPQPPTVPEPGDELDEPTIDSLWSL
jgi:hypothetical protein